MKDVNIISRTRELVAENIIKSFSNDFEKARSGIYVDNRDNRKLNRVGSVYGSPTIDEKNEKIKFGKGNFIDYTEEEDEIILDLIFVKERRKGIAQILIKELIKLAKEKNKNITLYAEPQLDAKISSEDLIKFYEKMGFEEDTSMGEKEFMIYKI